MRNKACVIVRQGIQSAYSQMGGMLHGHIAPTVVPILDRKKQRCVYIVFLKVGNRIVFWS